MKIRYIIVLIIISTVMLMTACNEAVEGDKEEVVEQSGQEEIVKESEEPSQEEPEEEPENEEVELVPNYELQADHTLKPIAAEAREQVVLLTIDDAPHNHSVEMARLLREREINAIFFVNGHFLSDEIGKEKLRKIHELGFEIGNHTMNHPNLKKLSAEEQREEIVALNNLVEEIIGSRPRFFRAPFGVNTDVSRQIVVEEGMQAMNWTYGYDFEKEYMEKDALAEIMVNTNLLRPGANLLMHDRLWTLEALPAIIDGIKEKDYQFINPKEIK